MCIFGINFSTISHMVLLTSLLSYSFLSDVLSDCNIRIIVTLLQENFYCADYPTTRSLARYGGAGLRTLFRFLSGTYDWLAVSVLIFKHWAYDP